MIFLYKCLPICWTKQSPLLNHHFVYKLLRKKYCCLSAVFSIPEFIMAALLSWHLLYKLCSVIFKVSFIGMFMKRWTGSNGAIICLDSSVRSSVTFNSFKLLFREHSLFIDLFPQDLSSSFATLFEGAEVKLTRGKSVYLVCGQMACLSIQVL